MEPKDIVDTENFKFFQHTGCEFFPCHDNIPVEDFNCMFCYCPLSFLQCHGDYNIIESPKGVFRKDCEPCTLTHERQGWEVVQKCLVKPKPWSGK